MTNAPADVQRQSLVARVRQARAARRQRRGDKAIQQLRDDLDTLGVTRAIASELDHAIRRFALMGFGFVARWTAGWMVVWLWSGWVFSLVVHAGRSIGAIELRPATVAEKKASIESIEAVDPMFIWLYGTGATLMITVLAAGVLFGIFSFPAIVWRFVGSGAGYREIPFRDEGKKFFFPVIIYRPASTIADVIKHLAEAHTKSGEERVHAISTIPFSPALSDIAKADRLRGTIPRFSHRRTALRDHTARVVTRMRTAEHELYRDPDTAIPQLADLWLTIAERYAQGRIGALLDDDLSAVEPARSWIRDRIRDAVAVVLTVGAVFFTASLDLPQAIEGYVIAGAAVSVLILVYGSKAILDRRAR